MSVKLVSRAAVAVGALLAPPMARATEGVVQIGASSVPFTITAAGSYRLVSNLVVGLDQSAIAIADGLDGVEIDLNGFSIVGPNDCTYDTTADWITCTSSDDSYGVNGPLASGVTVRNGFVRGMGQDGVSLGDRARVERVVAVDNQRFGVRVAGHSHVSGCQVSESIGGIRADQRSTVVGNVVSYTSSAIDVIGNGAVVEGNTVTSAVVTGIGALNYTVVRENVVTDAMNGISSASVSLSVARNVVAQARARGIQVGLYSSLRENVVYSMGSASDATLFLGENNSVTRSVFFPAPGRPNVVEDASPAHTTGVADSLTTFGDFNEGQTPSGVLSLGGNCCEGAGILQSEYATGSTACTPIPD